MKDHRRKIIICVLGLLVLGVSSCRYQGLRKKLDPENADLLLKVKYLISQREEKAFLELPDEKKVEFWEEFWKERDPTPDTEENELKKKYFERLAEAEQAFKGEGRPGWLTDRGRVYILYGPPTNKLRSPMGTGRVLSDCREIWYYGNFPVVFQDTTCIGEYRLMTFDLSPIYSLNINLMSDPGTAQAFRDGVLGKTPVYLDFEWNLIIGPVSQENIRGRVHLTIPFSRIWFIEENGMLSSTFDVLITIQNQEEQVLWEEESTFPVVLSQEELREAESKQVDIDIPFLISENMDVLLGDKNKIFLTLANRTDGSRRKKEKPFEIEVHSERAAGF